MRGICLLFVFFLSTICLHAGSSKDNIVLWAEGIVPYLVISDLTDDTENTLNGALEEWNQHSSETGVTFVPYDADVHDGFIKIAFSGSGTGGTTTFFGNTQTASIRVGSNISVFALAHELGHAIGLCHEHQREDRDLYVNVNGNPTNSAYDVEPDFIVRGPYDYNSIMHYYASAFTYPDDVEIKGLSTYGVSAGDILTVKAIYSAENSLPVVGDDSYTVKGGAIATYNGTWEDEIQSILFNDGDYDGDQLTLALVSDVTKGTLVLAADGTFTYKADASASGGTDSFVYSLSDGEATVMGTVTLLVEDFVSASAPTIATQSFNVDENVNSSTLVGTIVASDPNNESLSYTITGGTGKDLFDVSSGNLTILFSPDYDNGETNYTLEVNISNGTESTSGIVYIAINNVQEPPVVNAPINDQVASQDANFNFIVDENAFIDPDGDNLSYIATLQDNSSLPSWLDFESSTRTFSGTPTALDIGTLTVKVSASDGNGFSTSDEFEIKIYNTAGSVSYNGTYPDLTLTVGDFREFPDAEYDYSMSNFFSDTEGDNLSYIQTKTDGSPLPDWVSDGGFGILFFNPSDSSYVGTHQFRILAYDASGDAAMAIINVEVVPVNTAPKIVGTPETNVTSGEAYSFKPVGIDDEGDELTYSIFNKPSWASFNTATGELSGVPGVIDVGTTSDIIISASDGEYSVDLPSFNITVDMLTYIDIQGKGMQVQIYPNPSNGNFILTLAEFENVGVSIYNSMGKEVFTFKVLSQFNEFNLEDHGKGLYTLRVTQEGNRNTSEYKIIVN